MPHSLWKRFVVSGFVTIVAVPFLLSQPQFDPDTVLPSREAEENYNPYDILCSMNSWTNPVLDHNGEPHADGHAIQVIMDGGNGIQDPPNFDGSPAGDDTMAVGNFNVQYTNGAKHKTEGLEAGMFMGTRYFIPYKPYSSIYLRLWEASDPAVAWYYQDTAEYTTFRGNSGGPIVDLQLEYLDDIDWRFGPSKEAGTKK